MINATNRHSFRNLNFDEVSVSNRLAFQEYVHSQRAGAVRSQSGHPRPMRRSSNGSADIDSAAVKRLRLSNELTKAKSQIVVYKKKFLEAKEHYRTLVIEELAMSSLLPQAAEEAANKSTDESDEVTTAEGDGVIYIIHDGKAVCVPRTEIIYLSDIVNVISGSSPHILPAIISTSATGNTSTSSPLA